MHDSRVGEDDIEEVVTVVEQNGGELFMVKLADLTCRSGTCWVWNKEGRINAIWKARIFERGESRRICFNCSIIPQVLHLRIEQPPRSRKHETTILNARVLNTGLYRGRRRDRNLIAPEGFGSFSRGSKQGYAASAKEAPRVVSRRIVLISTIGIGFQEDFTEDGNTVKVVDSMQMLLACAKWVDTDRVANCEGRRVHWVQDARIQCFCMNSGRQ